MVAAVNNTNRARTFEISKSEIAKLDSVLHHGKLLKRGSHGSDVKELQHLLNHHGAKLEVDGDFGPKTEAAVRGFQRAHGLEGDGVVGSKTAHKLLAHKKPNIEDRFVKVGMQGKDVLAAEKRLKLLGYDPGTVDGKYDADTARAVRAFKLDAPELKDKSGQHMSAAAKTALLHDVKQLNHDPYHRRVTKNKAEHRRLDELTKQQAATGIAEGAQGRAVKNVQAHLKAAGYDPGTVDGKYDGRTAAMVKRFQSETGLPVTGTVDSETWHHLKQSYLYASGKADPSQTLGERSAAVKEAEAALKKLGYKTGAVDGVFDARTQQAVRAWERKNHKTVNGEISQAEFNKIQKQEENLKNGSAAYKTARSLLGKNASWVKTHEPLGKYMPDWVPNNVNCASFVSACLKKNGLIDGHQEVNVSQLADQLKHDKDWKRVSLKDAKPGDVVCLQVNGKPYAHVVMFAGWKNGSPQFIGSNNVNPDGSQRITQGYMSYPINAIYQYRG